MTAIAILIGNASYKFEDGLACCIEDVAAMKALIEATGRFSSVHAFTDLDGDAMRQALRDAVPDQSEHEEIFFYFSGHGALIEDKFYHCGTDFRPRSPNKTGLSHSDLHDLVRAGNPGLFVKVIDACHAGTLLIKSNSATPPPAKGFRSVFQIASSLNSQSSIGGEPLSLFTRVFLEAATEKSAGMVFYGDLANNIRDRFHDSAEQIPHFVNQSTLRDMLVDDAAKFAGVRSALATKWALADGDAGVTAERDEEPVSPVTDLIPPKAEPISAKALLEAAEKRLGGAADAKRLIDALFDGVIARFNAGRFADYFEQAVTAFPVYTDRGGDTFITRTLAREPRTDEMVTAKIERTRKKRNPWDSLSLAWALGDVEWSETFELDLNCTLERAQMRMLMTPQFRRLDQPKLVLTIAPSLEVCYVFELVTLHSRSDWDAYAPEGREQVRRWYKLRWDEDVDNLIEKICDSYEAAIDQHLSRVLKRLDASV